MSATIGLKNLYYALLLTDPVGGTPTYSAPVLMPGVSKATINPNASNATLFGDNKPMEVAATIGKIDVDLTLGEISLVDQAALLGHTLTAGVMVRKSSDNSPWVAIGFETLKANGSRRFVWLAKGKFSEPEQQNETKGDSISFQSPSIKGMFVMRDSDDVWEAHADEDAPGYLASIGSGWYNGVYIIGVAAPVTVTIVPANAATAIVVTSTIAWTFSVPINPADANAANFGVFKTAGMVAVAGTISINGAKTVVTFTPTVSLTAATPYTAIARAGAGMAADSATTFTTA
jgi:phi13 family phage major tail protein